MANKQTKSNRKLAQKAGTIFHGSPCITGFKDKDKNPANKRKSAWRGGNPASSKRTIKAPIETPTEE